MRVQSRFPPPLPLDEVDIEVGMAAEPVPVAVAECAVHVAPSVGRPTALRAMACASACGLSLVGCAMWQDAPTKPRAMAIEPVFRVDDTPLPLAAYLATARYFEGSRDWPRAAEAYAKASARDPSSVEALDGLGRMLAASGRLDAAEMPLRRAVELAPERARPRNNLAYVLLLKDQPQQALVLLDEALKLEPGYARARENRGEALVRLAAIRSTAVASNPPMEPSPGVIVETPPAQAQAPSPAMALPGGDVDAPSVPPSPPPSPTPIRLEISNGVGTTGLAAKVDRWMVEQGMPKSRLTNQPSYDVVRTRVDYRAGQADSARRVAASLPAGVPALLREQTGLRGDVRVVIGRNWFAATSAPRRVAALFGGLDAGPDL